MRKMMMLAAVAAFAFVGAAQSAVTYTPPFHKEARGCVDSKGKIAPAASCAAPVAAAASAPPHCVKGKVCGNSCIAVTKVCHKP